MKLLEEKSFEIKKIKETKEDWLLYPQGTDEPLKLSKSLVYGRLPPVWKMPWLSHELKIKTISGYIAYAEMDGRVLFDIPEEEYPIELKTEIERTRAINEVRAKMKQELIASTKKQLAEYLPGVPKVADLEKSVGALPVCWRLYLRLILPMQCEDDESQQRLGLMYWLISVANNIYKHYAINESLRVYWAPSNFKLLKMALSDLFDNLVEVIETKPEYRDSGDFEHYFEVRNELRKVLPPAPRTLELYLIQTIGNLLSDYAEDVAYLCRERCKNQAGVPLSTDSTAYLSLKEKMKMPRFSSLIVEKQFTAEDIEKFHLMI